MTLPTVVEPTGLADRSDDRLSPLLHTNRSTLSRLRLVAVSLMVALLAAMGAVGTVTAQAESDPVEVTFVELNDSGVTGTATLTADGEQTLVELELDGTGENHPAHVHVGTCDDLDPEPLFPLDNIGPDGRSSTTIDIPLEDLLATEHAIDVHLSPSELGTLLVCGDITSDDAPVDEPVEGTVATPAPGDDQDGTGGAIASENMASVPLTSSSDLGVTGTAVLEIVDEDTTRVTVVLSGADVTGGHLVHIHDGSCDTPGEQTIDLEPVGEDGLSVTEIDLSLDDLITGGYFLNVHQSEELYDTWFVCGDLDEATVGAVVPEVAPDTGASGSTDPTPVPTPAPAVGAAGDGTSGDVEDSGKGEPVQTSDLPAQAGTGSGLPQPTTSSSMVWPALLTIAAMLGLGGAWLRFAPARSRAHRSSR